MVLIKLNAKLARRLISSRENYRDNEKYALLEKSIQNGKWDDVPPIWLTPNLVFNDLFSSMLNDGCFRPTLKPFLIYNGHHRLDKAIEHNLPVRAYIRYTLGNPKIPDKEVLIPDLPY